MIMIATIKQVGGPSCGALWLHVIAYNTGAIRLCVCTCTMLSCARHGATSEDMLECVTHTCSVCVVSSFVRYERAGFTMAAHLPQFYCIQGERFDAYLYVKYLWPPAGATENGPENEHKGEQTEPQRSGLGLRDWI